MLPEVPAEPRSAGNPYAVVGIVDRSCASPEIGIVMQYPPPATVVGLRGLASRLGYIID